MFALVYWRNILEGQRLLEVNGPFLRVALQRGFHSQPLLEEIVRTGTIAGMGAIPEDVRRLFVCARDIAPRAHVLMQAAFQRHCDSGIAKTINIPADAPRESVRDVFLLAWSERVKGVTVYRDRSRAGQPMALESIDGEAPRACGREPGGCG